MVESSADMLLAIDRCIETISPRIWKILFSGNRIQLWLSLICLYGLFWAFFQKPAVFNGIFFAWLFNPFAGYHNDADGTFFVKLHVIHNVIIAICTPLIYVLFTIAFWYKQFHPQVEISRAKKMAFLQVFILSALNTLASFIYALMQYMEPSQWMITLTHFDWLSVHGLF
uniref:Serpentine receptor class gamma n=1 Tax=Globodera pallida TaxID=36090 RepID=A0A183C0H1_GLOPA